MRSRNRTIEVFSLSAVDLFASAMGAFIIISIIMMPDYQKTQSSLIDLEVLEELAGKTRAELDQSEAGRATVLKALQAAQTRQRQLEAEEDVIASEIQTLQAEKQASHEQPTPQPEVVEEQVARREVSFRFLGLKTKRTRILFMVDMNKYLAEHEELVRNTVVRAMDSLQLGYQFAILGFHQLDSGPKYYHWPAGNRLEKVSMESRTEAIRFLDSLAAEFRGSSSLLGAFEESTSIPVDAIILLSDGLPNPEFNDGLSSSQLARSITLANTRNREIHTVTVGDYFKYQGTVEFMEALAHANSGGFLALAP